MLRPADNRLCFIALSFDGSVMMSANASLMPSCEFSHTRPQSFSISSLEVVFTYSVGRPRHAASSMTIGAASWKEEISSRSAPLI